MSMNNSQQAVIAQRRELVARFRLRKRTQREIQADLAAEGCVNPDDGQPWSLGTINNDLKRLEKEWRSAAAASIEARKAAQMAEIDEAKRVAWETGDVNQVRLLIKLESELFGTEAPKRAEVTGGDGLPLVTRIEVITAQTTNAAADGDTDTDTADDTDGDDPLA